MLNKILIHRNTKTYIAYVNGFETATFPDYRYDDDHHQHATANGSHDDHQAARLILPLSNLGL